MGECTAAAVKCQEVMGKHLYTKGGNGSSTYGNGFEYLEYSFYCFLPVGMETDSDIHFTVFFYP